MYQSVDAGERNPIYRSVASGPAEWMVTLEDAAEGRPTAAPGSGECQRIDVHGSEADALRDRLSRVLAERDSVRHRAFQECEQAMRFATAEFARELMPIADYLHRAIEGVKLSCRDPLLENMLGGVAVTERVLLNAFEKRGIHQVVPPLGTSFDPSWHEALSTAEASPFPAGTIAEVLRPGYRIHDRLLRPAVVGVSLGDGAA